MASIIAEPTSRHSPSLQPGIQLSPAVREFLATPRKLLIGGKWVEALSGRTFETFNPATGGVLAHVAEADAPDVDLAVAAAAQALQGPWSKLTPADRSKMIWRLADLVEQHADQ